MSCFSEHFSSLPLAALVQRSLDTNEAALAALLERGQATSLEAFASLISPQAARHLERLAQQAQRLTQRHFGKTIRLFAPLYLSNHCINTCKYCGFSRQNAIPRITIPVETVVEETQKLARQGFRSLLLVAGEHPKFVNNGYLKTCVEHCLPLMPSLSLELGPLETDAYLPFVKAGCEGLVVYQETYHCPTYEQMHTAGPKRDYTWRLDTPERAYAAGFRRLGIGALLGLYDWRYEALALAAHAQYLTLKCWKSLISISFSRLRPADGSFHPDPRYQMTDREWVQLICAIRLFLPYAQLVLSTREPAHLRDGLVTLGITTMSAGSSTEPGGYDAFDESDWRPLKEQPGEQFHIADDRSPKQIASMIQSKGYDPVWKDADLSLMTERKGEPQQPDPTQSAQPSITIVANGKTFTASHRERLAEFAKRFNMPLGQLVVERNRQALTPDEARQTILEEGDQLELIRIVAGG